MKKYTINYSNKAVDDLKAIYNFITLEKQEQLNAIKIINAIKDAINSLNELPFRNPKINSARWSKTETRYMIIKNYMVFYIVRENTNNVYVVRIFSCKRNISEIINKYV